MGGRTVVKNTGFLYFRMLVMLVIAFFTSRVLLKALGIEGYGIYNVIGGIVAMFASLRGAFSSSIQRFLNYEKGKGNHEQLQKIFSMGINIHAVISIIFLLITETVGLWYLNYKLVIPPSRLYAANWVYQFSIIASIVTIMTIPNDAVIIANQRMNIYVYITLLEALLNLVVIFLLPLTKIDSLILYAFFVLLVSFIIRLVTTIYCSKTFEECKYSFVWNRKLFKELGAFAGWNFLGNTAFSVTNEGANIVLNFFGGPVANAARGVTYQVRGALTMFISNIQIAAAPHMTELYAQENHARFFDIFYSVSKMSFFIMSVLCVPLIVYTSYVLNLWLHIVPEYTVSFTQLTLFFLLVRVFHGPIDTMIKAAGDIKFYQIVDSLTLILSLPVSYLLLKAGLPLYYVFVSMIIFEIINWISILQISRKISHLEVNRYLSKVTLPSIIILGINLSIFYVVKSYFFFDNVLTNILIGIVCTLFSCCTIWFVGFNAVEKDFVKGVVLLKLKMKR